jgi:EpsI family protein
MMLGRSMVLLACFAIGAGLVARAERPEAAPVRTSFADFPMQLSDWRGIQLPPFEERILAVLGVDDYLTRAYYAPVERAGVSLYIGYYGSQRQGDTMHSPLNCLPGAGWEPISHSFLPVSVAATEAATPSEVVINRYVIQKGVEQQLVLYWYQSHGRVVASEYWGKFYLVRDAVRLNRTDGALVRVVAPITGDDGETRAELTAIDFVKTVFPVLGRYLPA